MEEIEDRRDFKGSKYAGVGQRIEDLRENRLSCIQQFIDLITHKFCGKKC